MYTAFARTEADCEKQSDVKNLLGETHSSRGSGATVAIVLVGGQEKIREMFTLGVNFVMYKPLTRERALSTLQAAQTVLYRDKRKKTRVNVHTQATIDYLTATGREWHHLIYDKGLTVSTNLFGTTYYSLVGLHAFHVTVGLIGIALAMIFTLLGNMKPEHGERAEVFSLYWHFVDAVWVIVFTVVYVIGR